MTQPAYHELVPNGDREFDVADGDFNRLEIHRHSESRRYHYFYDTQARRLVTDFVLNDRQRVTTLCTVALIRADDGRFTPRLRFWKKNKAQRSRGSVSEELLVTPELRGITAAVGIDEGHRNLWKLINFLQECRDISLPHDTFRVIAGHSAELVERLSGIDKDTLIQAAAHLLQGSVTQADLDLIADRKGQLRCFEKLLHDKAFFEQERDRRNKTPEGLWQAFFDNNRWIFGYGLTLVWCDAYDSKKLELPTTGHNAFSGAGKRVDALLRTRGYLSSLVFCEIKRHDALLLESRPIPQTTAVYAPAKELVGAVAQIQMTAAKAIRDIGTAFHEAYRDDGTSSGFEVATLRPRQIVVVGATSQFASGQDINHAKASSFELYRRSIDDVEIITYDELLARARFIVSDG